MATLSLHLRVSLIVSLFAISTALRHLKISKLNEIKEEDCPRKTKAGDKLTLEYTGTLKDGTVFESSQEEGRGPAVFMLGRHEVIEGWEEGLLDMCVGEKRKLSVPPSMAYGETGQKHAKDTGGTGSIPRAATIYFDVELLKIEDGTDEIDVFRNMDLNNDGQLSPEEVRAFLKDFIPREYPDQADRYREPGALNKATKHFVKDLDTDGNGLVNYDEFAVKHVLSKRRQQHEEL